MLRASVLKGVVLDNPTGRPLARAKVTVHQITGQTSLGFHSTALSDSYGRFEIQAGEGVYILTAARQGYLPARYGPQGSRAPEALITLGADASFVAELRMKRLGVITGEIWDENHLGISNVRVAAYRSASTLRPVALGESDDRGVFRIHGLTPGKYFVRTAPKELEGSRGLLPTFYGQTLRREGAVVCDVRLEQEISGINIEPAAGVLSTLTLTPKAPPDIGVTVMLSTDFGLKTVRVRGGEGAVFTELPPGNYEAFAEVPPARGSGSRNGLSGHTRVSLGKAQETAGVEMSTWSVFPLTCQTGQGGSGGAPVSITARRRLPDDNATFDLTCSNLNHLPLGLYSVHAVAAGMYLDRVDTGRPDRDKFGTLDAIRGLPQGVSVVFGAPGGTVAGVVKTDQGTPAAGAPVVLKPTDSSLQTKLRSAPWTTTGLDGRFRFQGLPPGQYEVISSFQLAVPEEGEWDYPSGKSVLVESGKDGDVEIGVTSIPEVE